MPYKHSILGVDCMTLAEFWDSEAKGAGKEPAEIMSDFYDDIRADQEAEAAKIKSDKSGALKALQEYYDPVYFEPERPPFEILDVINIIEASCKYNYSSSTTSFTALVQCNDRQRYVKYTESNYSGSYMEPPDYDISCEEIILD
jgi:hypothetical protein